MLEDINVITCSSMAACVLTVYLILQPVYGDRLLDGNVGGDSPYVNYERQLVERLRQQQLESEEDSRWLQEEETNLKKRLSIITAPTPVESTAPGSDSASVSGGNSPTVPPDTPVKVITIIYFITFTQHNL